MNPDTHQHTEGDAEHEDVCCEVVALLMQHLWRVVAVRAENVICDDLLSVHSFSHTQVNDLELYLYSNTTLDL